MISIHDWPFQPGQRVGYTSFTGELRRGTVHHCEVDISGYGTWCVYATFGGPDKRATYTLSDEVKLLCRHCDLPEDMHANGKCPFEASCWEPS